MLQPHGDAPHRLEDMTLDEVERYPIERALAAQGGNVSEAARVLGGRAARCTAGAPASASGREQP